MEEKKHWAESLQSGDRVKATLRHKTDGSLNRHNVELIVVKVLPNTKTILASEGGEDLIPVPYNELKQFTDN